MTSLLTTLPSLGFRSAGGLSNRVGCHALGDRGTNAVPWATRQQIRFVSSGDEDDHYATLRVKRSDPPHVINTAWSQRTKETHSDLTKGKDNTAFLKVAAAGEILRNPEKKAQYDAECDRRQKARQAKAAEKQRADDMLRAAVLRMQAARLREEAKRAKAAEEKKRDEERKAKQLADRAARRAESEKLRQAEAERLRQAEAERQRKAAEESPKEKERKAAIRAAKAAEKKKAVEEDARNAAELRKAAVEARKADLAKQREKEARMVVFRHVPNQALLWDVTQGLKPLKPGRILDSGVGRGTAWVEFWTAEQAKALHRTVTETDQFAIRGKTILNAAIFQGHARPPSGTGLITRCLYIIMLPGFLGRETNMEELVKSKLRDRGFSVSPVGYRSGSMSNGNWLVQEYASVAHAQGAKAAIERHYPDYLTVEYIEDPCGGLPHTAQEEAGTRSGSDKEDSENFRLLPSPSDVVFAAVLGLIVVLWDIKNENPSGENTQKNKQNESQSGQ